jgi:hypothetical protein
VDFRRSDGEETMAHNNKVLDYPDKTTYSSIIYVYLDSQASTDASLLPSLTR